MAVIEKTGTTERRGEVLEKTAFTGLGTLKVGKVRDVYVQDDRLILIATDRYSAFDRNLALIPLKGQALTQVSKFWFEKTADIIPNHALAFPDPNVVVAKKCRVLPVEIVVRGYITGVTSTALWTIYQAGGRDFGDFTLPDGLRKNQKLEQPVITPTTKFEAHDRPLTGRDITEGGMVPEKLWKQARETALRLYSRGSEIAASRGLILVDTKYEFGTDENGNLVLIDEIHTPDSSRYWQIASYEERFAKGEEPEYFDKEFLRLWFKEHCDPYKDATVPEAPREMVAELSSRYRRIFEQLTGEQFKVDLSVPILERMRRNLAPYFLA